MVYGVVAELNELIDFRRYARSSSYSPEGKALRSGAHLSKVRGRGMDFSEVRNYQSGDEIRHMEWRVTARTGRPHVKIYQEERERPTVILADFNPSMLFGTRVAFKSVVAARLAAMLAWTVIKQGDRVGGFFFSATEHSEFIPRSREAGVLPLLASLSHYTTQLPELTEQKPRVLSDALIRLRRVMRPGSIVVLISDFYALDEESEQHLARLRANNDILAYHINDWLELKAPKPQQYAMSNGVNELLLDTHIPSVNAAYELHCSQRIQGLSKQFQRLHIPYLHVTAEMDIPRLVRDTFPRRSRG